MHWRIAAALSIDNGFRCLQTDALIDTGPQVMACEMRANLFND
jgi:hypothetical protein